MLNLIKAILYLMITLITDLRAVLSGVHALLKKIFALMASGISTKTAKNGKKMKNRAGFRYTR